MEINGKKSKTLAFATIEMWNKMQLWGRRAGQWLGEGKQANEMVAGICAAFWRRFSPTSWEGVTQGLVSWQKMKQQKWEKWRYLFGGWERRDWSPCTHTHDKNVHTFCALIMTSTSNCPGNGVWDTTQNCWGENLGPPLQITLSALKLWVHKCLCREGQKDPSKKLTSPPLHK